MGKECTHNLSYLSLFHRYFMNRNIFVDLFFLFFHQLRVDGQKVLYVCSEDTNLPNFIGVAVEENHDSFFVLTCQTLNFFVDCFFFQRMQMVDNSSTHCHHHTTLLHCTVLKIMTNVYDSYCTLLYYFRFNFLYILYHTRRLL